MTAHRILFSSSWRIILLVSRVITLTALNGSYALRSEDSSGPMHLMHLITTMVRNDLTRTVRGFAGQKRIWWHHKIQMLFFDTTRALLNQLILITPEHEHHDLFPIAESYPA